MKMQVILNIIEIIFLLNKKFYIIANEVYKDRVIIINEKLLLRIKNIEETIKNLLKDVMFTKTAKKIHITRLKY